MNRWWDPGSPVDLLTPGDDPALDAANRLIAVHRTGAAALVAAAGIPLCDAGTVADALELTAAAARVEIAKADVDDVVTAANATATWLYGVCTAKGVIPPVAATRVAKVYGIPAWALGRYPALAADPKTPELVLTDTADRTLFGWVGTVTAAGEIAKAVETPEERRAAQAAERRDTGGRYTIGEGTPTIEGQSIADWLAHNVTGPAEVATPATEAPSAPKTIRRIKTIRTISNVEQAGARPAKTKAAKTRAAGLKEALARTAKAKLEEARVNAARMDRPVPAPFDDARTPIPDAVPVVAPGVFVMPLDEYEHFRAGQAFGNRAGDRVFQIGALNEYVHFAPTARVDVAGSDTHDESLRYVTHQIVDQPGRKGLPDPHVWELTAEEEHELDIAVRSRERGTRDRILREAAAKRLRKLQDELGLDDRDLPVARELGYVDYYLDATDESTGLLVWRPPIEFGDFTTHRPTTTLAEVVITDGYGRTDYGNRQGVTSNEYDPTMPVSIRDDPDPLMYYDRKNNAAIYRVFAKTIEDDEAADARARVTGTSIGGYQVRFRRKNDEVGKAVETPEERRTAQAAETRDAGGRYTVDANAPATIEGQSVGDWLARHLETPTEAPAAPAPAARPPIKSIKTIRSIRSIQPAAGEPKEAATRAAGVTEAGLREAAVKFAQAGRNTRGGDDELALSDNTEYHLVQAGQFNSITGLGEDVGHAPLSDDARHWLDNQRTLDDQTLIVEMFKRQMLRKSKTEGEHWHRTVLDVLVDVSATDEYGNNIGHEQAIEMVARHLQHAFKGDGNLTALEVSLQRVWKNGTQHVRVVVRGNARRLPTMAVVRRGDIDPSAPMLVTWEGHRRSLNLDWIRNDLRAYWPLPDVDLPRPQSSTVVFFMANPWVDQWVLHSPDEYLRDS